MERRPAIYYFGSGLASNWVGGVGGLGVWYVLLFVQELDFDLGSGFAWEVRSLDVCDQ